jgi:hypothetical protein
VLHILGFAIILQGGSGEPGSSADHILAAIIAAGALIAATVLQGWFFAVRLERLRARTSEDLENRKKELSKELVDYKHKLAEQIESARSANLRSMEENSKRIEEMFMLRNKRRAQLDQLLNAASIAKSGARELVTTSRLQPTDHEDIMNRVEAACRKISTFFEEIRTAEVNTLLARRDVEPYKVYGLTVMRVFSALDFDEGAKPDYIDKITQCFQLVEKGFDILPRESVCEMPSYPASLSETDLAGTGTSG